MLVAVIASTMHAMQELRLCTGQHIYIAVLVVQHQDRNTSE